MKLDIGGGTLPEPTYTNVDPRHGKPPFDVRIQDGIAISAESVSRVRASHVLEHIPSGDERIAAFNEVWRVLRPGGEFEIIVPCVGYTDHEHGGAPKHAGWQAWADQTHVSYWWYPESFWYFTGGPGGSFRPHADYGCDPWEEVSTTLRDGWEAHVILRKPV